MKKNNLLALCVLSLLAVSCQQDELVPRQDGLVTVGATMEKETISRSNVDEDGNFTWYTGDQIGIWGIKDNASKFYRLDLIDGSGEKKGYFSATLSGNITFNTGYAVYPYGAAGNWVSGSNTLTLNLPTEYGEKDEDGTYKKYTPNTNALMIASLEDAELNDLQFNHVGGVVCVTIENKLPAKTCGVRLIANKQITGAFNVENLTSDNHTITAKDFASNATKKTDEVTIYFKALEDKQTETMQFYFPVPTGKGYKFGLEYLVSADDGTKTAETLLDIEEAESTNDIERKDLLMMDPIKEVTAGGNFEEGSTQKVNNDDDMAKALQQAKSGVPLNLTAGKNVTKLPIPVEEGGNSLINISYSEAPTSLEITETTFTRAVTTDNKGTVNIFIPKTTSLETVTINASNLAVSINENKADEVTVGTLTVTAAADLVLGSGVVPTTVKDGYYGTGIDVKTYTVYTPEGLLAVNELVQDDLDANITLAANIELPVPVASETSNWTSLGKAYDNAGGSSVPYTGTFDGTGHSITGLIINETISYVSQGLIGYLGETGKVQNVELVNCKVTSTTFNVGGIAGYNKGTIYKCTVCGDDTSIKSTDETGTYAYVGGIAGSNDGGEIDDCNVIGSVTIEGKKHSIGGIVGYNRNSGKITNCTVSNTGSDEMRIVSTGNDSNSRSAGGIAGYNHSSTIESCNVSNTGEGKITINVDVNYAGGIAGLNGTGGMINLCTVDGVDITGASNSAGIAGGNSTNSESVSTVISHCSVKNSTIEVTNRYAGGIVGDNANNEYAVVVGCIAENSTVKGYEYGIGGIVGRSNAGQIVACYAKDMRFEKTAGATIAPIGGIVGWNAGGAGSASTIACYAYGCTEGETTPLDAEKNIVGLNFRSKKTHGIDFDPGYAGTDPAYGVVTACHFFASGTTGIQVTPITGEGASVAAGETAIDWATAAAEMNTAINTWNAANGNACTVKWNTTTAGLE